ncbi:MAG: hypothetical protein IJB34_04325 [Clostridia bacterium]|nr:hypothetical protein [Clostridia bacterium]
MNGKIDLFGEELHIRFGDSNRQRTEFTARTQAVFYSRWAEEQENTLVYDPRRFSLEGTAVQLSMIYKAGKIAGLDVSDEAQALFDEYAKELEALKEKRLAERLSAEGRKKQRDAAIRTLQAGCRPCDHLAWNGKRFVCRKHDCRECVTDAEEAERLYEAWKETRVYRRPTPFPHSECHMLDVVKEIVKNG